LLKYHARNSMAAVMVHMTMYLESLFITCWLAFVMLIFNDKVKFTQMSHILVSLYKYTN
jgi:uncharacterized membrane protein YqjE